MAGDSYTTIISPPILTGSGAEANCNDCVIVANAQAWDGNPNVVLIGTNSALSYGSTHTYMLYVSGTIRDKSNTYGSDKRWKKDIVPIKNVLETIDQLKGVNFYWRTDEYPDMNFDKNQHIGVIAQDVEKVYPELVYMADTKGHKSVDYAKLNPVLIEAAKELNDEDKKLEEENKLLRKRLYDVRDRISRIEELQGLRPTEKPASPLHNFLGWLKKNTFLGWICNVIASHISTNGSTV